MDFYILSTEIYLLIWLVVPYFFYVGLKNRKEKMKSIKTIKKYGYLIEFFKEKYFYW